MRLSEATIKTLTGNDRIVARRLNEGSVEFYPQFKLFINTNYRPLVSGGTHTTRSDHGAKGTRKKRFPTGHSTKRWKRFPASWPSACA